MQNNAFIIAEYNPFHNGHKYHIEQTKKAGSERVICIMNGNFVQRGSPALLQKLSRAESAVRCGADLVLELPLKYGISSAELFARGAVMTARATGISGTFSFGASAKGDVLEKLALLLASTDAAQGIRGISEETGKNYPAAVQTFIDGQYPSFSAVMKDPNNILALEYIKAIRASGMDPDIFCVERQGAAVHDSDQPDGSFASAKLLRSMIKDEKRDACREYMPGESFDILHRELTNGRGVINTRYFDICVLSRLADMTPDDFTRVYDLSPGMENRIAEAVKESACLENLYDSIKAKCFTHARIRRFILAAALGITREDIDSGVNYVRVLAANEKGRELLREMRKKADVPVITNLSDVNAGSSAQARRDKQLDYTAGKLYELCTEKPISRNTEFLIKPYMDQ